MSNKLPHWTLILKRDKKEQVKYIAIVPWQLTIGVIVVKNQDCGY